MLLKKFFHEKIIITEEHIRQNITDWTNGVTVLRGLSHRHTVQTEAILFNSCYKKIYFFNDKWNHHCSFSAWLDGTWLLRVKSCRHFDYCNAFVYIWTEKYSEITNLLTFNPHTKKPMDTDQVTLGSLSPIFFWFDFEFVRKINVPLQEQQYTTV